MEESPGGNNKRKQSDISSCEGSPESIGSLSDACRTPPLKRTPPEQEFSSAASGCLLTHQSSTPEVQSTPEIETTPVVSASGASGSASPQGSSFHSLSEPVQRLSSEDPYWNPDPDEVDLPRAPTPELQEPQWLPFDFHLPDAAPEDFDEDEEEVESDVDEDEDWDQDRWKPLYSGAPIKLHESMVSILTLSLKYSLSGQLLHSILQLIDLHLPREGNVFKKSLFLFKKYFSSIKGSFAYEYFCSKCYAKCERKVGCEKCHAKLCCLVKLPLKPQLQAMFKRKDFFSKLTPLSSRMSAEGIRDVYDGKLYKDHVEQKIIQDRPNLSWSLYWDGANKFGSSKMSVWTVQASINELPFSERYKLENLIVPALWCGPVKPYANLVLDSLYPDFKEVREGVDIEIYGQGMQKVSCTIISVQGDGPARDLWLNKVLHNGEYACPKCLQKGQPRQGFPGVRNFPFKPEEMIERDSETFERHGKLAAHLKHDYYGLHGPTSLSNICADVVRGTQLDSMHLVFGGAAKTNIKFFIDSSYSKLACNVTKLEKHIIDQRLLSIIPPHFLTRVPLGICDIGIWKTAMHKNVELYFGPPVFQGVIKQHYFLHYCTLVAAIQFLNADCVTAEALTKAKLLLERYVKFFRDLFGLDPMTLTFHLLLHLVQLVEEHGPLFVSSCFGQERVNGEVLKLVHGTRYAEMQIATSVQTSFSLHDIIEDLPEGNIKTFCTGLQRKTHKCKSFKVGDDTIIGRWKGIPIIPDYLNEAVTSLMLVHPSSKVTSFDCLRRFKVLYTAESYKRSKTRDSSSIEYYDENSEKHVGLLKIFLRVSDCACVECDCSSELFAVVEKVREVEKFPTLVPDIFIPNICRYEKENIFILIPTSRLLSVCVKMVINSKFFIAKRCNSAEVE